MQITDVRIRKVEKEGKMKAVVSITIDDEFVVHDIKVIEGEKDCLSQCLAEKLLMGNIEILLIQSILNERKYSKSYLRKIQRRYSRNRVTNITPPHTSCEEDFLPIKIKVSKGIYR